MENPHDFHFPPNQSQRQHNRGPINASTLPKTENTMSSIIECGGFQNRAQAHLPRRKPCHSTVARGGGATAIVKAKAHIPDLNESPLPVLYECPLCQVQFDKLRAICAHMKKHRNRSWKGLKPPSTLVSFNLNVVPKDEDM